LAIKGLQVGGDQLDEHLTLACYRFVALYDLR
jgi:hypothetical protein